MKQRLVLAIVFATAPLLGLVQGCTSLDAGRTSTGVTGGPAYSGGNGAFSGFGASCVTSRAGTRSGALSPNGSTSNDC
jgi:hypothetical protein